MDAKKFLEKLERLSLRRLLRPVVPLSSRECLVEGRKVVDFSSNDYLSLAAHPLIVEKSVEWTKKYGTGSKASRLISGTLSQYQEIEKEIAEWKKTESSLILGSGFLANTGAIPALADRKATIFADKLNHASLNSGALLSGADFKRYRHLDMECLEKMLLDTPSEAEKLILSDTVFSMDGDIADIHGLVKFAEKHNALLYFDDAHATGVFGENGEGLVSGTLSEKTVIMGTFSKAMGSYGAYIACSGDFRDYFINRFSTFIYSTALPPGIYGAISAAVKLVQTSEYREIREKLLAKSADFVCELRRLGFDCGKTSSQIIPVMIGDSDKAMRISQKLLENGILAVAVRPPTVPEGCARLRISLNASHTADDLANFAGKLVKCYET